MPSGRRLAYVASFSSDASLLVLWIMARVEESPVWLDRQRHLRARDEQNSIALPHLFRRDLLPTDIADELALLQDQVPPFPVEDVLVTLQRVYGRPVDILSLGRGAFLLTDDYAGVVYYIYEQSPRSTSQ